MDCNMGEKKRIAINMIAQFISFIVNIGINFYLTPYITANVGKEVYKNKFKIDKTIVYIR